LLIQQLAGMFSESTIGGAQTVANASLLHPSCKRREQIRLLPVLISAVAEAPGESYDFYHPP
jgi:hypothetical protein